MTETRCTCCDLPAYSCGKSAETRQRAEQQRARAALLGDPAWMAALYAGSCHTCGTLDRRTMLWRAECCA